MKTTQSKLDWFANTKVGNHPTDLFSCWPCCLRVGFPLCPKGIPMSYGYFIVGSSVKQWILIYGIPLPQISDSIQYFLKSESIRLKLLIPNGFLLFVFGSYSVKMLLVHEYDVCWDCKTKWRKFVQNKAFFIRIWQKLSLSFRWDAAFYMTDEDIHYKFQILSCWLELLFQVILWLV